MKRHRPLCELPLWDLFVKKRKDSTMAGISGNHRKYLFDIAFVSLDHLEEAATTVEKCSGDPVIVIPFTADLEKVVQFAGSEPNSL